MPTIGSLTYKIVAKTDEFKAGLDKSSRALRDQKRLFNETRTPAERYAIALRHLETRLAQGRISQDVYNRSVARLRAEMGTTSSVISKFGGTFAAIISVATATAVAMRTVRFAIDGVRESFEELDALAKQSRAIGITAGELTGLRLAAAEFSGTEAAQFDKALARMVKGIGEASIGTGELKSILELLPVDIQKLAEMDAEQQFLTLADAISGLESQTDRVTATTEIFGARQATLVNTLAAGSQAISSVSEKARELSQIDFVDTSSIERANDAMGRLALVIDGLFNVIASEFAPLVESFATGITDKVGESEDAMSSYRDVVFQAALATAQLIDLTVALGKQAGFLFDVSRGAAERSLPILRAAREAIDLHQQLIIADEESFTSRFLALRDQLRQEREAGGVIVPSGAAGPGGLAQALERLAAQREAAEEAKRTMGDAAREAEATAERLARLGEAIARQNETPLESYMRQLRELDDLLFAGAVSTETLLREQIRLKEEFESTTGKTPRTGALPAEARVVQAVQAGSFDAFRLAQGGGSGSAEERTAKSSDEIAKLARQQLDELRRIRGEPVAVGGLSDASEA